MTTPDDANAEPKGIDEPPPTPYGHEWVIGDTAPAWVQEFTPELRERAKRKMNEALDNADKPSGIEYKVYWRTPISFIVGIVAFSALAVAWLLWDRIDGGVAVGMFLGCAAYYALVIPFAVRMRLRTRISEPVSALRRLFQLPDKIPSVWDFTNRYRVVLTSDRDSLVRNTKFVPSRTEPTDKEMTFEGAKLQTYWTTLFPHSMFKVRTIQIKHASVDRRAPNVASVDIKGVVGVCPYANNTLALQLIGLMSIFAMQILSISKVLEYGEDFVRRPSVGTGFVLTLMAYAIATFLFIGLPWLLVKIPTSKIRPFPIQIRKLLVRQGDDWLVFNGELQGPEECDLSWLRELLAEREARASDESNDSSE